MSPWWTGAVIYQIYPRSFCDSNGDGIGDLKGIESQLDYIAALGVDALWLSPIFKSPQVDFGYDVSDYTDIDPSYGTLGDFDRLLARAHALGIKLLLDIVPAHTSEDHSWFIESLSSRDNPKADWYVWRDPKADGGPPNNWLSIFGGPAWSYHPTRRQYYLHTFYKEQPKLNLAHSGARAALFEAIRFWLARGVDGFRVDVINNCLIDPQLTDNPPVPPAERRNSHWANASFLQDHVNDFDFPGNVEFAEALRAVFDEFPDRFVLGEVARNPKSMPLYVGGKKLHSGYHFGFLESRRLTPATFIDAYRELNAQAGNWPCVAFSNHDFPRAVTRFGSGEKERADPPRAKLLLTLLMALKGTVLLYQGEELGLPEAHVPKNRVRDPLAKLYAHTDIQRVRDGCRTPMPWLGHRPHAGFSSAEPWLPVPPIHQRLAADLQESDGESTLNFARALIRARKSFPELLRGTIELREAPEGLLAFERVLDGVRVACLFNLTDTEKSAPFSVKILELFAPLPGSNSLDQGRVTLGPLAAVIARLA